MQLNRRKFIKIGAIASAALTPVAMYLASRLQEDKAMSLFEGKFNESFEWDIIDNNLLHLRFFFINIKVKGNFLRPAGAGNSFMVVRLPQMHVSEKGFWSSDWNDNLKKYPNAVLSGFSFLAFQLWPNQSQNQKIAFNIDTLLDWNNKNHFDLITMAEWFHLKNETGKQSFDFSDYENDYAAFKTDKVWDKGSTQSMTYELSAEPKSKLFKNYKSIISTLLDSNYTETNNPRCFIPATIFEVPCGMFLMPMLRDSSGAVVRSEKQFYKNHYVNQQKVKAGKRKYEVAHNVLQFKNKKQTFNGSGSPQFELSTPSFRVVGLVSEIDELKQRSACQIDCNADKNANKLPSLLDKTELAYLTQYADQEAKTFTQQAFDIREVNGFFFTGLGVITHLKYYNADNKSQKIDLIEYEHIITEGRDIQIKVARLGYNCKTAQRYKHVIEGRRLITDTKLKFENGVVVLDSNNFPVSEPRDPVSFVELKQYCECIDTTIKYNLMDDDVWKTLIFRPTSFTNSAANFDPKTIEILKPAITQMKYKDKDGNDQVFNNSTPIKVHPRRLPYTELTVIEKKRIPIDCLQDKIKEREVCNLENLLWFWPVKELLYKEDADGCEVKIPDYQTCDFTALDHELQKMTVATPFMFIRACLLRNITDDPNDENTKEFNHLTANYNSVACDNYIERRKSLLNSQKIAFTPGLPSVESSKSKTNILETAFIEHSFSVRNIGNLPADIKTETVPYLVFPQVLRAKVFIDHIRDLTQRKIPSVVDYHEDYIADKFAEYSQKGQDFIGNGTAMILKNTDAFTTHAEEIANNTVDEIGKALNETKEKLGNLVIPDIIPETVSLKHLNLTAPKSVKNALTQGKATLATGQDTIQKLATFNPRELLRGKLSDVCGLDLSAIVDELLPAGEDDNQTPLFEINKVLNKVQGEIEQSQVYKDLTNIKIADPLDSNKLKSPQEVINHFDTVIQEKRDAIEKARVNINEQLKKIDDSIPNQKELNSLVKTLFERYRANVLDIIKSSTAYAGIKNRIDEAKNQITGYIDSGKKIFGFIEAEARILKDDYKYYSDITNGYLTEVTNKINQLPEELKKIGSEELVLMVTRIQSFYASALIGFNARNIDLLFLTIAEQDIPDTYYVGSADQQHITTTNTGNPVKTVPVTFKAGTSLPANIGFLQYSAKLSELQQLVISNINGKKDQKEAAIKVQAEILKITNNDKNALQLLLNNLEQYQNDINSIIKFFNEWMIIADRITISTSHSAAIIEVISRCREIVKALVPIADFLRKSDIYYYYCQVQDYKKQIADTKRRFLQKLINIFGDEGQFESLSCNTDKSENLGDPATWKFENILCEIKFCLDALNKTAYLADFVNSASSADAAYQQYLTTKKLVTERVSSIPKRALSSLTDSDDYKNAATIYNTIATEQGRLKAATEILQGYERQFNQLLDQQAGEYAKALDEKIKTYIDQKEEELITAVGAENILRLQKIINDARNIYRLLSSIKQQDLNYSWRTTGFRDVSLGIVTFKKFSNPDTSLQVNVRATTHFSAGKFPPVIERVTAHSENRFSNFGMTFLNILTIGFSEVSFITNTGENVHFGVKIKDVKFDGALSFVQKFESFLKTMGKGLILKLEPDYVGLGYSLPIPSIQTPAFSFFNLSLNFDLRVYFDKRPLRFGFSLATAESKFGIAATIYAGFGFFGIVADPKHGIVEIECALEAGAWAGIHIGPISGEVKLAFGFYYRKNESGVRLEGYIVAEGRLSVWILEVSARIYLGIVSENSVVEGVCTVSYSVKLGFIKKSFSGSFHKRIAGAERQNNDEPNHQLADFHMKLHQACVNKNQADATPASALQASTFRPEKLNAFYQNPAREKEQDECLFVNEKNWKKFITSF